MATAVQQPEPQVVGNAFVQQYYHILHQSPSLVHQFYQDISQLGRPSLDGSMTITTTMEAINAKILSQNYSEFTPEIKTVDAQQSCNGGVHVLVTGCLAGKDNVIQNFTQTFFLATQEKGYFVLNDMLRYTGDVKNLTEITVSSNNVVDRSAPQQVPSPVVESEQIVVPVNVEISVDTVENGEVVVVKEEVPVAKVVVEVPNEPLKKVVSDSKVQEGPKKSYASIVMVMKGNAAAISSPTPAPRRTAPKIQEPQVNLVQASVTAAEIPLSGPVAAEDANNQESEADGYSIYIKGLPLNANPTLLEEEFKKFGTIKSGGIQVRSKQGFCFGFVEFETATAVEKAIEASPVMIGGRQVFVQEKMSNNNSHVNNRGGGRFHGGRMSGFRNEGPRGGGGGGRGNYGRGGGYNNNTRGDFNGRNDFGNNNNNRGGNWGGFSNRGSGGGNNGSRVNHSGGFNGGGNGGGEAKATTAAMPHVSATA